MLRLVHNQTLQVPDNLTAGIDEYDLFQRIIEGDALAFEAFYKHYYPRLFRFILRTTRQPETIEELIQETLLVVWEKPERFNYESKISTWVFGIAYHKAIKSMSKTARRSADVDELNETIGDPLANLAENTETQDWLNCALDILSADQRAVIELTFYHGLAYQDIAKVLDCPENTVKTRMFHARKKLQAFVEAQEN
ncbi:MAG TPA: RNA polymerase sigma factor [Methylobacter sp.]|jgi:RNA polymerase sigma-70 factor (ECF subfamily)